MSTNILSFPESKNARGNGQRGAGNIKPDNLAVLTQAPRRRRAFFRPLRRLLSVGQNRLHNLAHRGDELLRSTATCSDEKMSTQLSTNKSTNCS